MTLTSLGPPGTMIEDATTLGLSNENGDVGALWRVDGMQFGEIIFRFLMEAQVPPGQANAGNWEPARDLFDRLETAGISGQSAHSVDWAFYYETILPGDANDDGMVNGADYTIWADNFGLLGASGPEEGDFNRDLAVDGADYTIWADNFGATSKASEDTGGAGASAAELPACGLGFELLALMPVLFALRRR